VREAADCRRCATAPADGETVHLRYVRAPKSVLHRARLFGALGLQVVAGIAGGAQFICSFGKLFSCRRTGRRATVRRLRDRRTGFSPAHTQNSLTDLGKLGANGRSLRQPAPARATTTRKELELGVRCIAAGIYDVEPGGSSRDCRCRALLPGRQDAGLQAN